MSRKKRPQGSTKTASSESARSWLSTPAAIVVIAVLGLVIYSNTFNVPFIFDDANNIIENEQIRVTEIDLGQFYDAAFKSRAPRPVAFFSLALNYYFGGLEAVGYHWVNLIIHIANGVLVYFLASHTYRLFWGGNSGQLDSSNSSTVGWLSLFAACLFVAHPLQTQAVTYIVQRMTSLSALFYLLALLLYVYGRLSYVRQTRWLLWAGCVGAGLLSLGSKQISITLPVVILLYEWYFFRDLNREWGMRSLKYLFAIVVVLGVVALLFLGTSPIEHLEKGYSYRDFTVGERVLTQFRVVVWYLGMILLPLPSRLNLLHSVTTSHSLFDPITTLFSAAILLALVALAVYMARRQRLLSFCIFWFFITLSVESSIIALEMVYEHRVYLPMFGLAMVVPVLLQRILAKQHVVAAALACLVIISLGYSTYARNQVWQDSVTLWSDVIAKTPDSSRGHVELGHVYRREGKLDAAVLEYTKAIDVEPDEGKIFKHRAIVYSGLREFDLAMADFNQAIDLKPDDPEAYTGQGRIYRMLGKPRLAIDSYSQAIEVDELFSMAYNNRGTVYQSLGDYSLALDDYSKAIELKPLYAPAYYSRGLVHSKMGDHSQALADYGKTIELDENYFGAYNSRGDIYQQQGKQKLAITDYMKALALQPEIQSAHENLAWLLASSFESTLRNGRQAVAHAKKACLLSNWKKASSLDALAAAYAEEGNFSEAIRWMSKALQAAPALLPEMQHRLELYQTNQPYRQKLPAVADTLPTGGE